MNARAATFSLLAALVAFSFPSGIAEPGPATQTTCPLADIEWRQGLEAGMSRIAGQDLSACGPSEFSNALYAIARAEGLLAADSLVPTSGTMELNVQLGDPSVRPFRAEAHLFLQRKDPTLPGEAVVLFAIVRENDPDAHSEALIVIVGADQVPDRKVDPRAAVGSLGGNLIVVYPRDAADFAPRVWADENLMPCRQSPLFLNLDANVDPWWDGVISIYQPYLFGYPWLQPNALAPPNQFCLSLTA